MIRVLGIAFLGTLTFSQVHAASFQEPKLAECKRLVHQMLDLADEAQTPLPRLITSESVDETVHEMNLLRGHHSPETPQEQLETAQLRKVVEYQEPLKKPVMYKAIAEEFYDMGMRRKTSAEDIAATFEGFSALNKKEKLQFIKNVFNRMKNITRADIKAGDLLKFGSEAKAAGMSAPEYRDFIKFWQKKFVDDEEEIEAAISLILSEPQNLKEHVPQFLPNPTWQAAFVHSVGQARDKAVSDTKQFAGKAKFEAKKHAGKVIAAAALVGMIASAGPIVDVTQKTWKEMNKPSASAAYAQQIREEKEWRLYDAYKDLSPDVAKLMKQLETVAHPLEKQYKIRDFFVTHPQEKITTQDFNRILKVLEDNQKYTAPKRNLMRGDFWKNQDSDLNKALQDDFAIHMLNDASSKDFTIDDIDNSYLLLWMSTRALAPEAAWKTDVASHLSSLQEAYQNRYYSFDSLKKTTESFGIFLNKILDEKQKEHLNSQKFLKGSGGSGSMRIQTNFR